MVLGLDWSVCYRLGVGLMDWGHNRLERAFCKTLYLMIGLALMLASGIGIKAAVNNWNWDVMTPHVVGMLIVGDVMGIFYLMDDEE